METDVSRMASNSFSSGSSVEKYHGLIKQSFYKRTRNSLFQLFAYIYSLSSNFYEMHEVISWWRMLQIITPAFCASLPIWEKGSFSANLIDILSVPAHIVPVDYREAAALPFIVMSIVIFIGFSIFSVALGHYFLVTAQFPTFISNVIVIFCSTLGNLLHPPAFLLCGEIISRAIFEDYPLVDAIVLTIFQVIAFALFFFFLRNMITISVTFRPQSLMTLSYKFQVELYSVPCILAFLVGLAVSANKTVQIVLVSLMAVVYLGLLINQVISGGIINQLQDNALASSIISSMFLCIAVVAQLATNYKTNELELLLYIVIWIFFFYINRFIINSMKNKQFEIIDAIYDDETVFDSIKSVNIYQSICITGFMVGHPACISWKLPQLACRKWPEDIRTWYTYSKFVAIYPEETYILLGIGHSIMQNKITGSFAKQVLEQIGTLLRMREGNLSVKLKFKLNNIAKPVQNAKHKLRHVWDMAIQGNMSEMEEAINRTYTSVSNCHSQYNHLLRQYPNNRFLTRSYSRFLLDVCADTRQFEKYDADTKLLQRGIMANEDQAHELGLHAFPVLPNIIRDKVAGQTGNALDDNMSNGSTYENESQINEEMASIAQSVDSVVFPSFSILIKLRPILAILFFIVPVMFFIFYGYHLVDTILTPLDYVYQMSEVRAYVMMMPAYGQKYVMEKSGQLPGLPKPGVGNFIDIKDQFQYIINQSTYGLLVLSGFQNYKVGNEVLDKARSDLYQVESDYYLVTALGTERKKLAVSAKLLDIIAQAQAVISDPDPEIGIPTLETILYNVEDAVLRIEGVVDNIVKYVKEQCDTMMKIQNLIYYVLLSVVIIVWMIITSVMVHNVNKEKEEVFRCLTSLQKNVVSAISDKLKVIKKLDQQSSTNGSESEVNKQEENILKIFATAGDGSTTNKSLNYANIISAIVCLLLLVIGSTIFTQVVKIKSIEITIAAPHISIMMGAYAYQIGIMSNLLTLYHYQDVPDWSDDTLLRVIDVKKARGDQFFRDIRFGSDDKTISPFEIFLNKLIDDQSKCQANSTSAECTTADVIFMLFDYFTDSYYVPLMENKTKKATRMEVMQMWGMLNKIYTEFFKPLFENIVPTIKSSVTKGMVPSMIATIVIAIVTYLIEIIVLFFNIDQQNKLRMALRLLQHCPPNVVLQSSRIMAVLSGNFGQQKVDKTTRDSDYYHEIIDNMPDAVVMTQNGNIITMNKAAMRLFDLEKIEEGKSLVSLIDPSNEELLAIIASLTEQSGSISTTMKRSDGTQYNISISVSIAKNDNVYTIKDFTQSIRYNTLIAEERMKSDMLLASILPSKLVTRVQAGEKDISFEVQTASVIFMDIVEFTPWCASTQADVVMRTLNMLFTEFDMLVAQSTMLTRIKCIGDCYMAAGGIFAEVNQPDVHAKESVQFGLDAIEAVERVNKEIDQHLRIRVGVNTGGPLVAGVIGSGKPTFEIIGPVINMAQQMEHHGIPMQVHVSRAVYELIYGGSFNVKERGQIEVKNGTAITYLVTK